MRLKKITVEIICLLFIVLWTYAALSKLMEYNTFKTQISKSPYITDFAGIISWGIPAVELIIALSLTQKRTKLIGLYASFFLMLLFSSYIYSLMHFSFHVPCSCGGILSQLGWQEHLYFNIVLTVLALTTILIFSDSKTEHEIKNTIEIVNV